MKNYIGLLLLAGLALNSCKNEQKIKESTQTAVIPFTEVGNKMRIEAAAKGATPTNTTATNAPIVATAKGMNPPHGQAGHRCDIPVGAPLNSPAPPAQPNSKVPSTPQMTVTPTTSATATTTPTTPTPEGMNPPHGQEGHRCDIAVGAALPKE
ncbi:MAG: hypothetical protein KA278_05330 [Flavobacterium sp.]|nr:hypothetical protein [Flavobacterium sp.]